MSTASILFTLCALIVAVIGAYLAFRKQPPLRPFRPGDKVSLIELAISKLDPNFEPAGEQPWERKLDRFLGWIGLIGGLSLAGIAIGWGDA